MAKFNNLRFLAKENGRCLVCYGLGYRVTIIAGRQVKVACKDCRGSGKAQKK